MYVSPIVTQRAAELHQRDLRAEAAHCHRIARASAARSQIAQKGHSLPTLIAVQSLVRACLLSPRAARIAGGY